MQHPVIDLGSNLQANLKRWAKFLKGGGVKLSVFGVIYSGKKKLWNAKEISEALDGRISTKAVTMAGRKLDGEGLIRQVPDQWPVSYEKLPNVHHYKQQILSLVKQAGKPTKAENKSAARVAKKQGSNTGQSRRVKDDQKMNRAEVEQGKQVLERLITDLCFESEVRITKPLEWHYDFNRMVFWLSIEIEGAEKHWRVSYEDLTDSVADKNVRSKIERQLRMYVVPAPASQEQVVMNAKTVAGSESTRTEPEYDVFVSHATEDKGFVGPLVEALKAAGISVWYDRDMVAWGDDLRTTIDRGLKKSRFGIVVFSKAFLGRKRWTEHELNGLFAREKPGEKIILPLWHNITRDDMAQYSTAFADRIAMDSEKDSVEDIIRSLKGLLRRS